TQVATDCVVVIISKFAPRERKAMTGDKSLRLIVCLLILLIRASGSAWSAEILVTVDANVILNTGTANGAKLGINLDYLWDDQANRTPGSPMLSDILSQMKMKYLRYPDGEESDGHLWSIPPFTAPHPRLARISPQDWPSNQANYWYPPGSPNG